MAILLDVAVESAIAVLAVLKAGGAYLGLDPEQPDQRLVRLVESAPAAALITRARFRGRLDLGGLPCVDLDADAGRIASWPAGAPASGAVPGSLAYVIYTSGSTGEPKAVGGEHRHVVAYLDGIRRALGFAAGDSLAMHQPLAVDAPVTYLFGSLCHGGVLHLLAREEVLDPEALGERLASLDFTKFAPSLLGVLLDGPRPERLLPRRRVLVGGEAFPRELAARIAELAPWCGALNHYGPTETTVGVLTEPAGSLAAAGGERVLPLGRPLAHSRLYVVDRSLCPVPLGAAGEIAIGGATVTRGYLGQPRLTAERFVPDAWSGRPGARVYLSGDRGRWRGDGRLEFLGRLDHQVKIRGYRVELGEIEAVLGEHPAVLAASALLRHEGGRPELVAYVALASERPAALEELRGHLRRRLPEAMVPSRLVLLAALPRTPQGKIDRRALPAPEGEAAGAGLAPLAPRNAVERLLADLWTELLGRSPASVHDSFFDLGGHSLLAIRLLSRLREAFRMEVPLSLLFEARSLAALAEALVAVEPVPGRCERLARLLLQVRGMGAA